MQVQFGLGLAPAANAFLTKFSYLVKRNIFENPNPGEKSKGTGQAVKKVAPEADRGKIDKLIADHWNLLQRGLHNKVGDGPVSENHETKKDEGVVCVVEEPHEVLLAEARHLNDLFDCVENKKQEHQKLSPENNKVRELLVPDNKPLRRR